MIQRFVVSVPHDWRTAGRLMTSEQMEQLFLNAVGDLKEWNRPLRQLFASAAAPDPLNKGQVYNGWTFGPDENMEQKFANAQPHDPLAKGPKHLKRVLDGAETINGVRFRNPFTVFEAFLLSYYHWNGWPKIHAPGKVVVGDSGGFSIATLGAKIDPVEVIKWQMTHTTIGYILDIPPYGGSSTSARAGGRAADRWENSLVKTLSNIKRASQLYDPRQTPFRWWGVLQGEMRDQHEEWYDKVTAVYPFTHEGEGWAMRPHPMNDLCAISRLIRFAADKGIKRVHLLQTTGASAVAILFALGQQAGLEFVTYDSQTPARLGLNRTLLVRPEELPIFSQELLIEQTRAGETFVRDYMLSEVCDCEGCVWYKDDQVAQGAEFSHYIMLHNYCLMRDNFAALHKWAMEDPESLLRVACGDSYASVMRAYDNPRAMQTHAKTRIKGILDRIR